MRAAVLLCAAVLGSAATAQSTPAEASGGPRAPLRTPDADGHAAAARRGLAWLAAQQTPEGCWPADIGHKQGDDYLILSSTEQQQRGGSGHIGVTSLAALGFLAGGHLPGRGAFGGTVQRALDYVLAHVEENGFVSDAGSRMYSHAFATLFLAEVYGMLPDPRVKQALDRAVHWIVDGQNQQGAWRYNPFTREADLSVTVCQLQALRAARNIGIQVPSRTVEAAVAYVERSRTKAGRRQGLYYYRTAGIRSRRKNTQFAINAAAVTSLYSAGVYDRELVEPALDFLERAYPEVAYYYGSHYYFWYGNYYAAQAFFQAGGARFDAYYARLCRDLLQRQRRDGRWTNDVGPGDAFGTAVACILLQIQNQYLPIFQR